MERRDRSDTIAIRSRLILDTASALAGDSEYPYRQAQVSFRVQGRTDGWPLTLLASDTPEAIDEVVSSDQRLVYRTPSTDPNSLAGVPGPPAPWDVAASQGVTTNFLYLESLRFHIPDGPFHESNRQPSWRTGRRRVSGQPRALSGLRVVSQRATTAGSESSVASTSAYASSTFEHGRREAATASRVE